MKSSTAVFMLLGFSANTSVSRSLSSRRERKVCVCLGVCVTPTPTPQVWVPLQILFFFTSQYTLTFFHPLAPIVVTYFSLCLLRVTRTLAASPDKEVKSFETSVLQACWLQPSADTYRRWLRWGEWSAVQEKEPSQGHSVPSIIKFH